MSRDEARIDGPLSQSVEAMLVSVAAPVELLRGLVAQGAHHFGEPDGRRDEVAAAVSEVAKIVRRARGEALRWIPRVERRAAGPIELDRLEMVEDFLGSLDEFCSWARGMSDQSGGVAFDTEWRRMLLEAYERVLHACRSMRRTLAMGT